MSLSPAAPRRKFHTRSIVCDGYQRDDGLWDIEARIVDSKSYAYTEPMRGRREAGDHVHNMAVRLTLDEQLLVHAIEVEMPATPYGTCQTAMPAYQALVGKRIGLGWRRAVNEAVGGTRGCTHVRELLFPMATVAFQTISGWADDETGDSDGSAHKGTTRPYFLDGCKGWASDGEVVARFFPLYAKRPEVAPDTEG